MVAATGGDETVYSVQVGLEDTDAAIQPVPEDVASGQGGQAALDFHRRDGDPGIAPSQYEADHPAARAQIEHSVPGPEPDKIREDERVYRKTVATPGLQNRQSIVAEFGLRDFLPHFC